VSEKDLITDVEVVDDLSGVPVLPLRDVVVYPHMVIPLFVGRDKSIVALDTAMAAGKRILLVAQKKADRNLLICMRLARSRLSCSC
jgi:ATP-dependent Lon protease